MRTWNKDIQPNVKSGYKRVIEHMLQGSMQTFKEAGIELSVKELKELEISVVLDKVSGWYQIQIFSGVKPTWKNDTSPTDTLHIVEEMFTARIEDKEYQQIVGQIDYWDTKLRNFQNKCTHVNHTKEYKGSSGNYDPSNDCYWINFKCYLCGKVWQEDQ